MNTDRKYLGNIYQMILRACANVKRLRNNLHWAIEINQGFEKEHKYALVPATMEDKLLKITSELYDISNELHHMREVMKEALE